MVRNESDTEHTLAREELLALRARCDVSENDVAASASTQAGVTGEKGAHATERPLKLHILGSGSKGNAAIVEGPEGALLIDCGLNKKTLFKRCEEIGFDVAALKAILITHEHNDHISGLGVCTRGLSKRGIDLPIFITEKTRKASRAIQSFDSMVALSSRDCRTIAGIEVSTFPTSHDAADPIGFRFVYGEGATRQSIGYATDTGRLSGETLEMLSDCTLLALESNHDPFMLEQGPYPYMLKQRVASDKGHLSNRQAAEALETLLCNRLECIVGMHLSETNNTVDLPAIAFEQTVHAHDHPARVLVSYQYRAITV